MCKRWGIFLGLKGRFSENISNLMGKNYKLTANGGMKVQSAIFLYQ